MPRALGCQPNKRTGEGGQEDKRPHRVAKSSHALQAARRVAIKSRAKADAYDWALMAEQVRLTGETGGSGVERGPEFHGALQ